MKHWRIDDVPWDRFDRSKVQANIIPLVKAAAMVERNGSDYALYLNSVFGDDPSFQQAANDWAQEEIQHGEALGRWAMLADPNWDFADSFDRYRTGYRVDTSAQQSLRGSRAGELIARCMVETGTSSYYTALGEEAAEPVLKQICKHIAADEFRHYKLFYDHLKRYLEVHHIGILGRLRIALSRIGESEDEELAFAYHCGNEPASAGFDHNRCMALYLAQAMTFYRFHHVDRAMGMVFKAVGLRPRSRIAEYSAKIAWSVIQHKKRRYALVQPLVA